VWWGSTGEEIGGGGTSERGGKRSRMRDEQGNEEVGEKGRKGRGVGKGGRRRWVRVE